MKNFKSLSIRKQIIIAVIIAVIGAAGVIPWAIGAANNKQTTVIAEKKKIKPVKIEFYYLKNIQTSNNPSADWVMKTLSKTKHEYIFTNTVTKKIIDSVKQPQDVLQKIVNIKHNKPILTQKDILPNAYAKEVNYLNKSEFLLQIELNANGTKTFYNFTKNHVEEILAVFINDRLVTAPRIMEPIKDGKIGGIGVFNYFKTQKEAQDIADGINSQGR